MVKVGDIVVHPLHDGSALYPVLTAPPGEGIVPPSGSWDAHRDSLTEDGRLRLEMGAFLVLSGDRVILVDAGAGPDHPHFPSDGLLTSLALTGVGVHEVTDVVFTHLHRDHIGWATRPASPSSTHRHPVFPRATYRCHAADWEHFVPSDDGVTAILEPVADRVELWPGDSALASGVDLVAAPGHTPGSTVVVLSSGVERALLLGDVVHCPAELLEDDWLVLGDIDPELAQRTRNALAREIEQTGSMAVAAHFPGLNFGRILSGSSPRQWSR